MAKVVSVSKVSSGLRISLTREIAEKLGVKEGDFVVFVEDGKGNLIIKKAE